MVNTFYVCKTGMKYMLILRSSHSLQSLLGNNVDARLYNLLSFVFDRNKSLNRNTTFLISKYAKVAHWSAKENETNLEVQQGRSSNSGQDLWPRRSDLDVVNAQTRNSKPRVMYQYPVYKRPASKISYGQIEKVPAVGEVIQDRFNPPAYFDYGKVTPSSQVATAYGPPKTAPAAPARQAPPPLATPPPVSPPSDSFPAVFNVAPQPSKPPVDLYTSPYSSYNPSSDQKPPGSDKESYPPVDSYAAPPPSDDAGTYDYKPGDDAPKDLGQTLGPPLAPDVPGNDHGPGVDAPPSDHGYKYHDDGPPDYPPKSIDDVYYPPDFPKDSQDMMDKPTDMMGNAPPMMMGKPDMMADSAGMMNSADMMNNGDMLMDQQKDMAMDLSPPAPDDPSGHFPPYLYDNPHFDHHVYEEVHHTTTAAPAPVKEDKRVSSTHYSYYYLGRKLWYIPLYFSIYFMLYVTALILKSIARHKVEFKNDWISAHSRSGRQMNFDDQMEKVDNLHRNITSALDIVSKTYSDFAM